LSDDQLWDKIQAFIKTFSGWSNVMSNNQIFQASILQMQPVSVTRQMAAAFPKLRKMVIEQGLKLHHLGAGYPHPEVSDPTSYIRQKDAYFRHLAHRADPVNPESALKNILTGLYGYYDTLGPTQTREAFAHVYGRDFGFEIDPNLLIPTIGATGGIDLVCYTGFISRAVLYQKAAFYSVEMDREGADPDMLREQIRKARREGFFVPCYYTVPDGHNPGGISFSQQRRDQIMEVVREEGILILEDAPYTYISYEQPESRPRPFIAMDAGKTIHLFTASKIGLPGPRIGFLYTTGHAMVANHQKASLKDLLLTEASATLLLHNPEALRGFEAYLMDERFQVRDSLWGIAAQKNYVYKENRDILLEGLQLYLGDYKDLFSWTIPGAGFFSVFTIHKPMLRTDQQFIEKLVAKYGIVTIPMFGFYPNDAKQRDPAIGLNQLRLSFSYNETIGQERRDDLTQAVYAFANAMRLECNLPPIA
jgi:DNA-binding transcriptional MocR family regulator